MSANRFANFQEVMEQASLRESHRFELKGASYVVLKHPGNGKKRDECGQLKPITQPAQLKAECQKMLAKECGAFANSGGGTLVIGLEDDGDLDEIAIPEFLPNSTKESCEWVASLVRVALEPPLEAVDCYQLKTERGGVVIVVTVSDSEKAPHQSTTDKRYYHRSEKSSVPATHWLIEMIRNRRVHPRLEVTLDPKHYEVLTVYNDGEQRYSLTIRVAVTISNVGRLIARTWAVRFEIPFATTFDIQNDYCEPFQAINLPTEDSTKVKMFRSEEPIFPTQQVVIPLEIEIPVLLAFNLRSLPMRAQWRGLGEVWPRDPRMDIEDEINRAFMILGTVFADSAEPKDIALRVKQDDIHKPLEAHAIKREYRAVVRN